MYNVCDLDVARKKSNRKLSNFVMYVATSFTLSEWRRRRQDIFTNVQRFDGT